MFKKTSHTVQAHTGLAVFQLQFLGICNSKKKYCQITTTVAWSHLSVVGHTGRLGVVTVGMNGKLILVLM